jgi:prepilin-type N-terminal cleavage/methylation domain-containing protein
MHVGNLRARLAPIEGERGFTLVELLVSMTLGMIILLAVYNFASIAQDSQADTTARGDALADQRAGMERMTRELRQATTVNTTTPGLVIFQVYGSGGTSLREIRYDCRTGSRCQRHEGPAGGPLAKTHDALVSSIQSATFTPSSLTNSQDYVTIELRVSLPGRAQPIVLSDGVALRNKGYS